MRISDWSSDVCSSDLRGPGSFNVAAANAAPANSVTLSALLDTKRVRRARTGAVRGSLGEAPTAAPRRPNLWMVDVAQSGTLCIADPASLRLWRATAAKPATTRNSGEVGQATASLRLGCAVGTWPVAGPVRAGAPSRLTAGSRAR